MKQKHKWKSLGFFAYYCSVCGDFDCVSDDRVDGNSYITILRRLSMAKEQERIQNRTDCFEMYIKHKVVPRLLGKT